METKQTAVEWLLQQVNHKGWGNYMIDIPKEIIEQAKQMEKEQIEQSFVECWKANVPDGIECKLDAEQYYNETYGN